MITCCRCDCKIENGDEYKIAYNSVYCIFCAEDLEDGGTITDMGDTYTLDNTYTKGDSNEDK